MSRPRRSPQPVPDAPPPTPAHASPEDRAIATAQRFLTALYGEAPDGRLTLWTSRNKLTAWPDTVEAAAKEAVRLARRDEVYFGVGLRRSVLATGRGNARDVLSLPALWADLDVKAPAHKAHDLPPDKAAALALLADFPLPASAIVDSGYGYHAYWFLDTPYVNSNVGQTKGLLGSLGQALVVIAERHGWKIDTSVFEPARVLRVPGTFNRKEIRPKPVRIEHLDESARYSADRLLAAAEAVIVEAQAGASGGAERGAGGGGDTAAPTPADEPVATATAAAPDLDTRVDYARAALQNEANELATTGNGGRNAKLNDAAFRLATLFAAYGERGWPGLTESDAWVTLWTACLANGLAADRKNGGEARCRTTFESGWNAGLRQPRRLPADLGVEAVAEAAGETVAGHEGSPEAAVDAPASAESPDPTPRRAHRQCCNFIQHDTTDIGNAGRLAELCRTELRRCEPLKQWFVWSGVRWRADDICYAQTLAKRVARSIAQEAADAGQAKYSDLAKSLERWARASSSRGKIEAMLGLAMDELAVRVTDLDRDPWLLNCKNGTVDLRSGELKAHDPADLITRFVPVDYEPRAHLGAQEQHIDAAALWHNFLTAITGDDADLAGYMQRAVGLTLIGAPLENVLFFAYGPPGTGKSTFLDVLLQLLGEYAQKVTGDVFMSRGGNSSGLRPEIAQIRGTRLVVCDETNKGRRLDVGLVNDLTGSAQISARALYQSAVTFPRTFTPWIASNYRPEIVEGEDSGIWRRLHEMPFDRPVPDSERKPNLAAGLVRKAGVAILAWAVEGALAYQRDGLGSAERVAEATAAFKWEMNPITEWLDERGELVPDAWTATCELYDDYRFYCEENGERWVRRREMTDRLQALGFQMHRMTRGRGFHGLRLRGSLEPDEGSPIGYRQTPPTPAEHDGYDANDSSSDNSLQSMPVGAGVSDSVVSAEVLGGTVTTVITVIPDPAEPSAIPDAAEPAP